MHTRASNSELVEPLYEPERTLNRRLRRQNRRVPFKKRNEPPSQPKFVYAPILDIKYFRHFLDILENYNPKDDEPMWAAHRVVAPTSSSAITILETTNEFSIKAKTWPDELNEGTIKTWDELCTALLAYFPTALFDRLLKEIQAFSQQENETLTESWLRIKEVLRNCYGHNLSKGNIIRIFYYGLNETTQKVLNVTTSGIFLYKTPNQAYQLLEGKVLLKLDWAKNQKTKSSLKKTVSFTDEGSNNSDTNKIMARMNSMTMKMNVEYKEFQSRSKQPNPDHNDDDKPMSTEEEAKFMQTFHPDLGASINPMPYSLYAKLSLETLKPTKMSVRLADRSFQHPIGIAKNMLVEVTKFTFSVDFVILEMEEDNKVPLILGGPFLYIAKVVIQVKQKKLNLGVGTERITFHIDSAMKHSYSNDDTCFSIDVIDEILKEDFDALFDEGSKILYSIEGTIFEEKLFAEFDEFMAMTADENSESDSDTEEPPFEKITFNTDYKIKTSLEETPSDLELKHLPDNLEY
ncbi:reverse transcriptase domain-containing protein, partial [Tanacetum coccineum]